MWSLRPGVVACGLGAATWLQFAAVPALHQGFRDPWALVVSLVSAATLVGAWRSRGAPPRAAALALLGYPLTLAALAVVLGRGAALRYDAPALVLPALTACGFAAAVARWTAGAAPRVPTQRAALEPLGTPRRAPPLRSLALTSVGVLVAFTSVVGPAALAARGRLTASERLAGELLVRGRLAVVTVGGLALALAVALGAGGALLRATPRRQRQASRAVTYGLWAAAAWVMRYWLDHAR